MVSDASQRQSVVMRQAGDRKDSGLRESITLNQIEAPETHTFRGLIQL